MCLVGLQSTINFGDIFWPTETPQVQLKEEATWSSKLAIERLSCGSPQRLESELRFTMASWKEWAAVHLRSWEVSCDLLWPRDWEDELRFTSELGSELRFTMASLKEWAAVHSRFWGVSCDLLWPRDLEDELRFTSELGSELRFTVPGNWKMSCDSSWRLGSGLRFTMAS